MGLARTDEPTATAVAATSRPAVSAPVPARINPRGWLLLIWAVGAAVSFLRMALAYASLWRTRRNARPYHGVEVPPGVAVLETPAGSMPMTFGFLRPAVFLPADSRQWSEERRRIVLLHELAHVRRGDTATHLLALTALNLNWWNPLAWLAWREFLKERERATDDLVLRAGARASEYASHLLEVARSMQIAPAGSAAVAMARRSELEGRLLAILDTRINRTPIRGAATPAVAALLAAALVAPFAAMKAQAPPSPAALPELHATIAAAMSQKNYEMLDHAASVYLSLRKYEMAQTLLENALTIRGEVSGPQSADYAVGLVKLGDLSEKRNQRGDALSFYTKAVSLGDRPEVAPALVSLGIYAFGKRDYPQALDLLQRAVNIDPNGPQAGRALTWMASVREASATISAEVESLLQRALALEPPDSLDAAVTLELYARLLNENNRADEARQYKDRAAEIRRRNVATDASLNGGQSPLTAGVFKVGGGVSAPMLVSRTEPAYTEEARAAKYQGTVLLGIEVGPDGLAHNIHVIRSLGLGLDEKAVEAVGNWQFKPGTKDGQAVTVIATIEVNFRLQ